jgi:hypothetical protein
MQPPTLNRPWWIAAFSLLCWLACTFVVVNVQGDDTSDRWVNQAFSALASAFAVGVVGGGFVSWWDAREKRWSRVRPVLDLLLKSTTPLAITVARIKGTREVVELEATGEPPPFSQVLAMSRGVNVPRQWFTLPLSDVQLAHINDEIAAFKQSIPGPFEPVLWRIGRDLAVRPDDRTNGHPRREAAERSAR